LPGRDLENVPNLDWPARSVAFSISHLENAPNQAARARFAAFSRSGGLLARPE
jgi:hypothetical protein